MVRHILTFSSLHLLLGFASCVLAIDQAGAATYFVSPAGKDAASGSMQRPWRTITHGVMRLRPGDTLVVRDGVYDEREVRRGLAVVPQQSGMASAPITVEAEHVGGKKPSVVWKLARMDLIKKDLGYWTFEGIHFESTEIAVRAGQIRQNNKVHHITFRHCHFEKSGGITISYADDVLIERCHFRRIQSAEAGKDLHGIEAQRYAHRLTVRDCRFEDISADGVQMGNDGGDIRDVLIESCQFWINRRPDGSLVDRELQQQWRNTGENGIDIKQVNPEGSVTIRACEFHGFRPTVPGQNASGAYGVALTIHLASNNITVDACRFYDNTTAISVNKGVGKSPPKNVVIRNCLIHDNRNLGVMVGETSNVQLVHNTFFNNPAHLWITNESRSATVINNLFWRGRADKGSGRMRKGFKAHHNAWSEIDGPRPQYLTGKNDLLVDDPALDPKTFTPRPNSPLLGKALPGTSDRNFDGKERSERPAIGAF